MTEDWTKEWERRIVNGVYPLRRYLGRSNHSVVFLTECKAQNLEQAAIKILPAKASMAEAQLQHWKRVATLSHPHLIRLLDSGRCQLGGHNFLFVVMDLAEQNLAQILPGRPLTAAEVGDLLSPTLDALAYLHDRNLVHGGLKPPNLLVVGDQLKLASDTIRPAGEGTATTAKPSVYDPPEAKNGSISAPGDVWGLGITLAEALTQTAPAWSREQTENPVLHTDFAPEYLETVQACLNRDPDRRPSVAALISQFNPPHPTTPLSAIPPVVNQPLNRTLSAPNSPKSRFLITAISVAVLTLWAIWLGVHEFHRHAAARQAAAASLAAPAAEPPPVYSAPTAAPASASRPASASGPASGPAWQPASASGAALPPLLLHQELPDISRRSRESIRGVIKIAVRVSVDRSGNVIAANLDDRKASRYLGRAATEAAKKWKFAEAADPASRVWLLHFDFTRSGISTKATAVQ